MVVLELLLPMTLQVTAVGTPPLCVTFALNVLESPLYTVAVAGSTATSSMDNFGTIEITREPLFVLSKVEVANTETLVAVSSLPTVSLPVLSMVVLELVLPVTLQVTVSTLPTTRAVNCLVPPSSAVKGESVVTATENTKLSSVVVTGK